MWRGHTLYEYIITSHLLLKYSALHTNNYHTNLQQSLFAFQQSTGFEIGSRQVEQHLCVVEVVKLAQTIFILQKKTGTILNVNVNMYCARGHQYRTPCVIGCLRSTYRRVKRIHVHTVCVIVRCFILAESLLSEQHTLELSVRSC